MRLIRAIRRQDADLRHCPAPGHHPNPPRPRYGSVAVPCRTTAASDNRVATPFDWRFTRADLADLLHRIDAHRAERIPALVTGANKGIGYEIAAGLGVRGFRVGVGALEEQRRDDFPFDGNGSVPW